MKKPQISILTLLLAIAIVALGLRLWQTSTRLTQANDELAKARLEVGHLEGDDPTKFHIVAIPTDKRNCWRWRIRLPDGVEARLICLRGEIPAEGFLTRKWTSSDLMLGSRDIREFVLTISLIEDTRGKSYLSVTYNHLGYSQLEFDKPLPAGMSWSKGAFDFEEVATGDSRTESFDMESRVPLLRVRNHPKGDEPRTDGFLAWLTIWSMRDTARKAEKEQPLVREER